MSAAQQRPDPPVSRVAADEFLSWPEDNGGCLDSIGLDAPLADAYATSGL